MYCNGWTGGWKDIGNLCLDDVSSRFCSCERTISISTDDYKLFVGPSPWEWSKDINSYYPYETTWWKYLQFVLETVSFISWTIHAGINCIKSMSGFSQASYNCDAASRTSIVHNGDPPKLIDAPSVIWYALSSLAPTFNQTIRSRLSHKKLVSVKSKTKMLCSN